MKLIMPEKWYFELPTDKWDLEIHEYSPLNYEVEVDYYKWETDLAIWIIVWKWWSTHWYQNKYITISNNLVKNHGVHVFIIENPWISWDDPEIFFDNAFWYMKNKMKKLWYNSPKFYIMGYSAGGHFVWRFAYKYPEIKQLLLVNPVLRVNNKKLLDALKDFRWIWTIIIGENDSDYLFYPLLESISPNIKIIFLPWVDHLFSNEWGLETYIELPEKYFHF